ncbi:hypothetical protein [Aureispira anguillae]|uniref:Uncharacterized protein n=1 Tax=Aureispira anguillae TaxID=2864201 RepID=A0A915Y9K8_9BACT|nr:hypothetical protein [Aureispira anguillae]BDS09578.1 hypothetical protein AsAng_0002820 [Aureispira anguillae]
MSCFESSTFLKNPEIMNQDFLIQACEQLGWKYKVKDGVLKVYNAKQGAHLHGEPALIVKNNTITHNSFYMKNGKELVAQLQSEFYQINVSYAKETIISEFESVGFMLKNDNDFEPNEKEVDSFFMVAYSKLENEDEPYVEIRFTILYDGTIVSDSNYIPSDIHELADEAMEKIDEAFGSKRREGEEIIRKEVPIEYQHKSYCTNNKIKAKN